MKLSLVAPDMNYIRSYREAVRSFKAEGLWWYADVDPETILPPAVPGRTDFWAIVEGEFAGKIHLWHELTPELRKVGGHIGYDVAPKFRRKGVASEMLRKLLPFAKSLGLIEVLLTCDDTNAGSIKAIEKNGGVLKEKKLLTEEKPLKRYYWIPLN